MNSGLNLLEKWFTIFSLIFLTGMLRWASLFVSPDAKAISTNSYNPFDSLSSLIQLFVYGVSLFFLATRLQTTLRTANRHLPIWILPIIAVSSFLWSDFPDESLRKGITTLQTTSFGLYFASRFNIKQQLHILAWVFGIVAVVSLLFSIVFRGAAIEAGANAGALRGPFTQKNLLARLVVLGAIVFLINILDNPRRRWILWTGFLLNVLLILLTTSKTALLLLVIIIFLLPLYKALRWKTTLAIPLVILVILIGSSISLMVLSNWEASLNAIGRDPSLSGRTGLWEASIEKILHKPWLGYGYQAFWREGGEAEEIWSIEGYKPPHAHNGFINMPLDLGLSGLFVFLMILLVNYLRSIVYLRFGKTMLELWPIYYITFFFMYNHSENTIIEHNSIFWALLVSVTLSINTHTQTKSLPSQNQRLLSSPSQPSTPN